MRYYTIIRRQKILRLKRRGVEPKRIATILRVSDPEITYNIVLKAIRDVENDRRPRAEMLKFAH